MSVIISYPQLEVSYGVEWWLLNDAFSYDAILLAHSDERDNEDNPWADRKIHLSTINTYPLLIQNIDWNPGK